jgi:CheB methylesterase
MAGLFRSWRFGASAGGLEAYKDFFQALSSDTGMAFVLVQHLDPSHDSMLTEIIAKATAMPVEEVKSGVRIKPNGVYVIPPNAFMSISDGMFALTPRTKGPGQHLAVNFFMRSLAESRGIGAIGIIFSGTGADGALGLESIKAEGGITFAQEPSAARYDGMPRSVIDSGCVDFVLPPKGIAKEIERMPSLRKISTESSKPGTRSRADIRIYAARSHWQVHHNAYPCGPTAVKVQEEIESVLNLYAKRITAKNITVAKEYQADGASIHSYPGEVRQIFSTLLINAMEAVPINGRFALRVSKSADWSKVPAVDGLRITLLRLPTAVAESRHTMLLASSSRSLPPREKTEPAWASG